MRFGLWIVDCGVRSERLVTTSPPPVRRKAMQSRANLKASKAGPPDFWRKALVAFERI